MRVNFIVSKMGSSTKKVNLSDPLALQANLNRKEFTDGKFAVAAAATARVMTSNVTRDKSLHASRAHRSGGRQLAEKRDAGLVIRYPASMMRNRFLHGTRAVRIASSRSGITWEVRVARRRTTPCSTEHDDCRAGV
jgi:hypothetical protein